METKDLINDPNMPTAVGVGRVAVLLDEKESKSFGQLVDYTNYESIRRGEVVLIGQSDNIFPMSENLKIGAICSAINWSGKQIIKLSNGKELAVVYHADLVLFF